MFLAIRKNEQYFKLSSGTNFHSCRSNNTVVLPAPTIYLNFKICLNNNQWTVLNYNGILQQVASRFITFWGMICYDTSIDISTDSEYSFTLVCKDQMYHSFALYTPIHQSHSVQQLSKIDISLQCLSRQEIRMQTILDAFDYLLVSWYLHMEQLYPCVFSIVGRKFIELNLFWSQRFGQILENEMCNHSNEKEKEKEKEKDEGEDEGEDDKDNNSNYCDELDLLVRLIKETRSKYTTSNLLQDGKPTTSILDLKKSRIGGRGVVGSYPVHLIDPEG
ncbi:hypothetical protein LELG_04822 [Lodderomyces elongisporus NRRL YB-4239]|uniref:Uncharacterized protein n=1 Tax=Lodderomyces elongisporus (strain ATCC 11503 / CBS 2605 / JCM 1781 / NBRC 1676 / NRRL YB-4239) TaxID=379508 RepID=A5E5D3_LODEL|nr:hypothetical protein LELG_04822 [Lodderomyces elongisporus NRRL YB-4239]